MRGLTQETDPAVVGRATAGHASASLPASVADPAPDRVDEAECVSDVDDYNHQDVTSVLPPSRRSSLSSRRTSTAGSALSFLPQHTPTAATTSGAGSPSEAAASEPPKLDPLPPLTWKVISTPLFGEKASEAAVTLAEAGSGAADDHLAAHVSEADVDGGDGGPPRAQGAEFLPFSLVNVGPPVERRDAAAASSPQRLLESTRESTPDWYSAGASPDGAVVSISVAGAGPFGEARPPAAALTPASFGEPEVAATAEEEEARCPASSGSLRPLTGEAQSPSRPTLSPAISSPCEAPIHPPLHDHSDNDGDVGTAVPWGTDGAASHVRFSSHVDVIEAASRASTSAATSPRARERADSGGSLGEAPPLLTPDELQLERLKTYSSGGSGGDASGGGVGGGLAVNDGDGEVSTLDFLRDMRNAILPDVLNSMFASTTTFLKVQSEALANAVPQPLRHAASRAGGTIATAADWTGSMLTNLQVYAVRSVPDKVLSPKWKYLIFVDALNVLGCSWNVNILVAPYILRMGGLVGGTVMMVCMQVVCCYYTEVFFQAKHQLRRAEHVIAYGDVPRMTFGVWFPTLQLWYDGVALVATVVYATLNLQALLPHMNIRGSTAEVLSLLVPSFFSLPFVFMKRARSQLPMLTLASVLVFIALIMMFAVFPYGSVVRATVGTINHEDTTIAVLHLYPKTVAEFFVALSVSVYLSTPLRRAVPVERTMSPRRYVVLLRVCTAISSVVYIAFAVCVLVSYGTLTCSVLPMSFRVDHAPLEVAIMVLLFFAFLFYIPLVLFEVGELCDRRMLGWRAIPGYGQLGPNLLRIFILAGSAAVAWTVPYYGLLVALCGSVGYAVVGVLIPAALDYACRQRSQLLRGRQLRLRDYAITFAGLTFGCIILFVGTVLTLYQIWLVAQAGFEYAC